MRWSAWVVVGSVMALGCGGQSDSSGSGGSATGGSTGGGAGGSGGTSAGEAGAGVTATGGSGGTAIGGSGGTATGGSGGTAIGGSGGTAAGGSGGGSAKPECTQDTDCKPFEDCCTCAAVAKDANPAGCDAACTDTKCKQLGVPSDAVACVAGRCVKGFDCDTSKITCKVAEPACAPGQTPQVSGTCYTGACVTANQCSKVPSCAKCAADEACATYVAQLGPQAHCVSVPASCGANFTCGCLGPTTCVSPFDACSDLSGIKGVSCGCPVC